MVILWLLNVLADAVYQWLRKRCCATPTDSDVSNMKAMHLMTHLDSDRGLQLTQRLLAQHCANVPAVDFTSKTFPFNPAFATVQLLGHVAHFVFISVTTHGSAWQRYTQLYTGIVNSGALVFFAAACAAGLRDNDSKVPTVCSLMSLALLLPGILTHSLPMAFVYCLVPVAFFLVCMALIHLQQRFCPAPLLGDPRSAVNDFCETSLRRFVVFGFVVFCIQTTFNYGVLFFTLTQPVSALEYFHLIETEWTMRSTTCYFTGVLQATRQAAAFASIFGCEL